MATIDTESNSMDTGIDRVIDILRSSSCLQGVEQECVKVLAMLTRSVRLHPGDTLVGQGEENMRAYYVSSGSVHAGIMINGEKKNIGNYGAGQWLCWSSLFGRVVSIFTLEVAQSSEIFHITRDDFNKVMEQFPRGKRRVVENLVGEMRKWDLHHLGRLSRMGDEMMDAQQSCLGVSLL